MKYPNTLNPNSEDPKTLTLQDPETLKPQAVFQPGILVAEAQRILVETLPQLGEGCRDKVSGHTPQQHDDPKP